jgi:hypothetical protein
MKIFFSVLFAVIAATSCLASAPSPDQKQGRSEKARIESANTVCPVSGDQVGGDMGKPVYVEYQGKKIGLCCKYCVKDFKKNPAKYAALAEKNQAEQSDSDAKKQ